MKKLFLTLLLSSGIVFAADILTLVKVLDRNDTVSFKSMIQTVVDANTMREDNNKTVLMYAVWIGHEEAVRYLVSKGADVNALDSGGASALHLAIWKGHDDIALFLLDNGASTQTLSLDGMTPADIAIMKQNKRIMEAIETKSAPKLKSLF